MKTLFLVCGIVLLFALNASAQTVGQSYTIQQFLGYKANSFNTSCQYIERADTNLLFVFKVKCVGFDIDFNFTHPNQTRVNVIWVPAKIVKEKAEWRACLTRVRPVPNQSDYTRCQNEFNQEVLDWVSSATQIIRERIVYYQNLINYYIATYSENAPTINLP